MGGRVILFLKTLNLISKNQSSLYLYIYFTLYLLFLVTIFYFYFLVDNFCFFFFFFNKQPLNCFLKNRCSCISKAYTFGGKSGWCHTRIPVCGWGEWRGGGAYSLLLDWEMSSVWGFFKYFILILRAFFF